MITSVAVSNVLCAIPCVWALALNAAWWFSPSRTWARKENNLMKHVFGPLCGVRRMNEVNTFLMMFMCLPILVGVWLPSSTLAVVTTLCLAMAQPYLCFVGIFLGLVGARPAPCFLCTVIGSALFGANLVWRVIDDAFHFDASYTPVIVGWHMLCSVVCDIACLRFDRRVHTLRASIQLAKEGDAEAPDSICNGEKLSQAVALEQARVKYTPPYVLVVEACVLCTFLGVGMGLTQLYCNDVASYRSIIWISCVLVIFLEATLVSVICTYGGGATIDKDRECGRSSCSSTESEHSKGVLFWPISQLERKNVEEQAFAEPPIPKVSALPQVQLPGQPPVLGIQSWQKPQPGMLPIPEYPGTEWLVIELDDEECREYPKEALKHAVPVQVVASA